MNNFYDLIIIGGGPAGMMAGISAKNSFPEKKILILEKNDSCGKKLLLTGKGRCNLTTSVTDINSFIETIGKEAKWFRDALNTFSIEATIDFFTQIGIKVKEERGKRIFPIKESAFFVRDKILNLLKQLNVKIEYNSSVISLFKKKDVFEVITSKKNNYKSYNVIIATGGLSYPITGSTGDGYNLAENLGHTIITPRPALIGIKSKESWTKQLAGLTLKNVKVDVYQDNKKKDERFGDILFTHIGISGPIILDMSKNIHHLMNSSSNQVSIHIDTKPALTNTTLDDRLQKIAQENGKSNIKSLIKQLLPGKMVEVFITLNSIDQNKIISEMNKAERKKIVSSLKKIIITLGDVEGFEKAIITSGGISLKEINPKTMESKVVSNLYFAGEVIDLDGPTGGYNLQIAWSTGFVVGKNIK